MIRPRPSRWLGPLLERLFGSTEADAVGDLEEEFRARIDAGRARFAAELWYTAEAISLAVAIAWSRLQTSFERPRQSEGESFMRAFGKDLIYGLRSLYREAGVTVVVSVTLAVAVGATTAIFGVANAAFRRPLPHPEADRLVSLYTGSRDDPGTAFAISPLDWQDIAALSTMP